MKTKWLFPHRFRLIGWLIFVPFMLLGLSYTFGSDIPAESAPSKVWESSGALFQLFKHESADEILAIGLIAGLLFIAFSREKVEDEMISQLRLEALQWSVYANYLVLAIAILTVYDGAFFNVMIYNMFTVLLVFIARFRWLIFGTTILRYEK